jgi:tryptophan synthase alpha subunit
MKNEWEDSTTFADDLIEQIKECGDIHALRGMGIRLAHELSEARDIAFIGLASLSKLVSCVEGFEYSDDQEQEKLASKVENIQENSQEQMRQRWAVTSEAIKELEKEEEEDWQQERSEEQVH